ncbi:CoA transferase [Sphingobium chlorophenolicum]|uniref:Putative acyl-CoA transferase/carnitine dehydratase n=1 Tax=Sphingobium chlorophenolicum TaxID=46429 RepID=A0A081RDV0_SPHCR|nr:CoA transferase [Sphingobium chlorophenolicum]KEQ53373.1 putative acyl-CoA transferase/carnitine dehydratase [Sphingobium chlorophenolicum]
MAGPLEHIVVIEAAPVMPGSIAGMLLADHGAQVIKVEPRGGAFFAHDRTLVDACELAREVGLLHPNGDLGTTDLALVHAPEEARRGLIQRICADEAGRPTDRNWGSIIGG